MVKLMKVSKVLMLLMALLWSVQGQCEADKIQLTQYTMTPQVLGPTPGNSQFKVINNGWSIPDVCTMHIKQRDAATGLAVSGVDATPTCDTNWCSFGVADLTTARSVSFMLDFCLDTAYSVCAEEAVVFTVENPSTCGNAETITQDPTLFEIALKLTPSDSTTISEVFFSSVGSTVTSTSSCPIMGVLGSIPDGGNAYLGTKVDDLLTTWNTQDPNSPTAVGFMSVPNAMLEYLPFQSLTNVAGCTETHTTYVSAGWYLSNDLTTKMCTCGNEVITRTVDGVAEVITLTSDFGGADETSHTQAIYSAWWTIDYSAAQTSTQCVQDTWDLLKTDKTTAVDSSDPIYLDPSTNALTIDKQQEMAKTSYWIKATTMGLKSEYKQIDLTINLQDYSTCNQADIKQDFQLINQKVSTADPFYYFMAFSSTGCAIQRYSYQTSGTNDPDLDPQAECDSDGWCKFSVGDLGTARSVANDVVPVMDGAALVPQYRKEFSYEFEVVTSGACGSEKVVIDYEDIQIAYDPTLTNFIHNSATIAASITDWSILLDGSNNSTDDANCVIEGGIKFTTNIHSTFGSTLKDFNKVFRGHQQSGFINAFGSMEFDATEDPKSLISSNTCAEFNVVLFTTGLVMSDKFMSFSVCKCGNEVLSTAAGTYTISENHSNGGIKLVSLATYEPFFVLDTSVADCNSQCQVNKYQLTSDTAGTPFMDGTVISINSATQELEVPLTNPMSAQTVYLEATTLGGKKAYKELSIVVIDVYANCDPNDIEHRSVFVQDQILSAADTKVYFIDAFYQSGDSICNPVPSYQRLVTDSNTPLAGLSEKPTCNTGTDDFWCWFEIQDAAMKTAEQSYSINVYSCMDDGNAVPTKCYDTQLDFQVKGSDPCGSEVITGAQPLPEVAYDLNATPGSTSKLILYDYIILTSSIADCPVSVLSITNTEGGSKFGANLQELSLKVFSDNSGTFDTGLYPVIDYNTVFPFYEMDYPTDASHCVLAYITGVSRGLILQQENYYLKVCVCGKETIEPSNSTGPVQIAEILEIGSTSKIDIIDFETWFNVLTTSDPGQQSSLCTISSFRVLDEQKQDCAGNSQCAIQLTDGGSTLTISLDEVIPQATYYLEATTRGQVTARQELEVAVLESGDCRLSSVLIDRNVTEVVLPRTLTRGLPYTYRLSDDFEFSSSDPRRCPLGSGILWEYKSFNAMAPDIYDENYASQVSQFDITGGDISAFTYTISQRDPVIKLMRLQIEIASNATQVNADFRIVVCGDEIIDIPSGNDTVQSLYQKDGTPVSIELSEYSEWFTMQHYSDERHTRLLSAANCTIDSYRLCEDAQCATVLPELASKTEAQRFWMSGTQIQFRVNEMYSTVLYVGATTIGLVTKTKPVTIQILCGNENLTSAHPYFYNVTQTMKNGTATLDFADWFTSDVDFKLCPIEKYFISVTSWVDLRVYASRQTGQGKPIFDQSLIGQSSSYKIMADVLLKDDKTLQIATDDIGVAGTFYLNLTAKSRGNQTHSTFIRLIIEADPATAAAAINFCPQFAGPQERITLLLADLDSDYTYRSDEAFDPEGDFIEMAFTIPAAAESFLFLEQEDKQYRLTLDKTDLTEANSGTYELVVTLSDGACQLVSAQYSFTFEIVWAVPSQGEELLGKVDDYIENGPDETATEVEEEDEQEIIAEVAAVLGESGSDVQLDAEELEQIMNVEPPEIEIEETPITKGVEAIAEVRPPDAPALIDPKAFERMWMNDVRKQRLKALVAEKKGSQGGTVEAEPVKKKPPKEFKAKVPKMSRDGSMNCTFSNKLKVPAFIANSLAEKRMLLAAEDELYKNGTYSPKRPRRKLVAVEQLDVNRDLMNVKFFLKSSVKVEDIGYYVTVKNWTAEGFVIGLVITTPMLISQGIERDEVEMTVKNPYLFASAETGELLDVSKLRFFQTLPRQLPVGMSEEEIAEKAKAAESGMTALIILQICVQLFMKQNMADMMVCIFTIQLCCYYTFYATSLPGNAEIYLEQFRSMIKMDAIQPDNLLKLIDEDLSVDAIMGIGQERLNNAIESSGIKTVNPGANLATFLQIIAACVCIFLFLLFCYFVLPKLRPIVEIKIKTAINDTYYNGIINGQTFAYLQASIAFGISFKVMDWDKPFKELYPKFIPLGIFLVYPGLCILVLRKYRAVLPDKKVKAKIGNLYKGLRLVNSGYAIYYNPVWLYRRFVFVMTPLIFEWHPAIQLVCLIFLNVAYAMFYQGVRPHQTQAQVKLEAVNECGLVLITYHMICFTWFVQTKEAQFLIGYSFLGALLLILGYNISFILKKKALNAAYERRKRANQIAYEKAFQTWYKDHKIGKDHRAKKRTEQRLFRQWENERIKDIIENLRGPVHQFKNYRALGDDLQIVGQCRRVEHLTAVGEESAEESRSSKTSSGMKRPRGRRQTTKQIGKPDQVPPKLLSRHEDGEEEDNIPLSITSTADQYAYRVLQGRKKQINSVLTKIDELYLRFVDEETVLQDELEATLLELNMACTEVLPKKDVEIDERISNYQEARRPGIIEKYVATFNNPSAAPLERGLRRKPAIVHKEYSDIELQVAKEADWELSVYFKMLRRELKKVDAKMKKVTLESQPPETPTYSENTQSGFKKAASYTKYEYTNIDKMPDLVPTGQDYDVTDPAQKLLAPHNIWDIVPREPLTPVEIFKNRYTRHQEFHYRQQMKEINMGAVTNTNLLLAYAMYSAHPDFADEHDHVHDMDADQNYTREIISDDSPSIDMSMDKGPPAFKDEMNAVVEEAINIVRMEDAEGELDDYDDEEIEEEEDEEDEDLELGDDFAGPEEEEEAPEED